MKQKNNEIYPWYKQFSKDNMKIDLNYPEGSLFEIMKESALEHEYDTALEYFGTKIKYNELLSNIEKCAKSLRAIGIKKDDIVSICMPNTPEAVVMFYAINAVGAVASMIHPLSAEEEIKYYLKVTKSKTILVADFNYKKISKIKKSTFLKTIIVASVGISMPLTKAALYWVIKGRKLPKVQIINGLYNWNLFLKLGRNYKKSFFVSRKPNDRAVILYSGGTTGKPKGVILSNINFNSSILQFNQVIDLERGDSVLGILPLFHGFGLCVCTHFVLYKGLKNILIPQFSPKTFGELVLKNKPSFIVLVPTLLEGFINSEVLKDQDLSFLKGIIAGGDSLNSKLKEKADIFLNNHGSKAIVREGYGLTECVSACCVSPLTNYKKGSIGIPFPGLIMKIVDSKTNLEMPFGKDGEICVNGPTVMKGYLNNTKETNMVLKKHKDGKVWLHTGDLGKMDKDGYFYFSLRMKRMIVSNGYNVFPNQIETVINKHPKVNSVVVVGVPHQYKGQQIKAVIVLKENINHTEELEEEIKALCRKHVSKYALPTIYEFKTQLPKTLLGKIAYRMLSETDEGID